MKVYSRGMPTGLQQTQLGDLSVKDCLVVLFRMDVHAFCSVARCCGDVEGLRNPEPPEGCRMRLSCSASSHGL